MQAGPTFRKTYQLLLPRGHPGTPGIPEFPRSADSMCLFTILEARRGITTGPLSVETGPLFIESGQVLRETA